MTVKFPARQ